MPPPSSILYRNAPKTWADLIFPIQCHHCSNGSTGSAVLDKSMYALSNLPWWELNLGYLPISSEDIVERIAREVGRKVVDTKPMSETLL